ncbi:hypothetical protein B0O80DRAFT_111121 [Mortierella sp. GBAus27b]|nr:hypothetical protein B0O80DRAFT_111121 [Mortierella sp. GBAus27b]
MYEILQISYSPSEYIRSPYNYVDLAAYICPIVGCFFFLLTTPNQDYDDNGIDKKIWVMGFGIMFLYLNVLGIAVNIIFHITRRISWFFLIFGLFLLGFTHTLLYVLHTRRLNACQSGPCDKDGESSYPTGFFEALSATYFFLSGRYDPVNSSFGSNSVGFHIMMIIFYFFTVLLLLNILIGRCKQGHWELYIVFSQRLFVPRLIQLITLLL